MSGLRPTSWTGQPVAPSLLNSASVGSSSSSRTRVLQIMWWKMKRPPTVARPMSVGSMSLTSLISTDLT